MAKEWLIVHSLLHIELIKVKYNLIIGKYINQSQTCRHKKLFIFCKGMGKNKAKDHSMNSPQDGLVEKMPQLL